MTLIQFTKLAYLSKLVHDKTKYCVFFDFHGHVDKIDIRIKESREEYTKDVAYSWVYTDPENHEEEHYEHVVKVLTDILDNGEIDYDLCEVEEIVTIEKQFTF